jgi:thioredoxin reductase (NADPH)
MNETKVLIIGAGAAGLSCALYLKRANVDFVLLEKGAPGGKLLTIASIANYPGFEEVTGTDLALSFLNSATKAGVEVTFGDVVSVIRKDGFFLIETSEEKYQAKAVVVATGLANIATIKGEKDLFAKGVSYCATCDGPLYKNKDVAVYGAGDRSLEEALYLTGVAQRVYLISPDSPYKGIGALYSAFEGKANAKTLLGAKVTAIEGDGKVERIRVQNVAGEQTLALAAIFPLLGEKSASAFLSPLAIRMDKGFILVDENQMSSVPGVFAAGDIVKKKLRQVVTAASDGAVASSGVISYLRSLGGKA